MKCKTFLFLKEILRKKTIGRILLFWGLKNLFEKELYLNKEYSILEIGSEPASHQRAFFKQWNIIKSNYKPMPNIDLIIDAEKKFLIEDKKYDGVMFFNVLSCIKNYQNCLEESLRISKKFVIFNIPLISGIARHPMDYNRFTKDKLDEIIKDLSLKFKINKVEIIPLGGSFSSAISLIDSYLKFRFIRLFFYSFAILFDKLDLIIKRECPMQYLVFIEKS